MPEFQTVFSCKTGQRMAREMACKVWQVVFSFLSLFLFAGSTTLEEKVALPAA